MASDRAAFATIVEELGQVQNHPTLPAAFEELLADRLRVLGPDHPDTLTTRNNLAYWRDQATPES